MKTLILASVVGHVSAYNPHRPPGLYWLLVDGDHTWVDGQKQHRIPFASADYPRIPNLLFRDGRPGEQFRVLKEDVRLVEKFSDLPRADFVVHCEVWA